MITLDQNSKTKWKPTFQQLGPSGKFKESGSLLTNNLLHAENVSYVNVRTYFHHWHWPAFMNDKPAVTTHIHFTEADACKKSDYSMQY